MQELWLAGQCDPACSHRAPEVSRSGAVACGVEMPSPLARASGRGGDATLIVAAAIAAATSYTTIASDFNIGVVVAGCAVLGVLTVLRLTP